MTWPAIFYLITGLVRRDLKGRYAGSFMGLFWSVFLPLINLSVFTFIFSTILNVNLSQHHTGSFYFALYLFVGLLPWLALQESLFRSVNAILDHASLVKWGSFPPILLPIYLVISAHLNSLIGFFVLLALLLCTGMLGKMVFILPFFLVAQFCFVLGLAFILSTLGIFVRDTAPVMSALMTIWMYLTPIFYPETLVPNHFRFLLWINPVSHLIRAYRDILLNNTLPDLKSLLLFPCVALIIQGIGYLVFTRSSKTITDVI